MFASVKTRFVHLGKGFAYIYKKIYPKQPRQILTVNRHGRFLRQIPTASSRGKQP